MGKNAKNIYNCYFIIIQPTGLKKTVCVWYHFILMQCYRIKETRYLLFSWQVFTSKTVGQEATLCWWGLEIWKERAGMATPFPSWFSYHPNIEYGLKGEVRSLSISRLNRFEDSQFDDCRLITLSLGQFSPFPLCSIFNNLL